MLDHLPRITPKLSATRAKQLQSCSWEFFCNSVLKLPERIWGRTNMGNLAHIIFECLANPRHKKKFDEIMAADTIDVCPSVKRLADIFYKQHKEITPEIAADLDSLVMTGLKHDFFFSGAKKVLPPEWKFELTIGKAKVKGFLDRVAFYDDHVLIRDYKSQRNLFTEEELADNIQAGIYQLAVKEAFGLPAKVEFVLLRHPPTKKLPQKHLQVVEPYSDAQLAGLTQYMEHLYEEFNSFNEEKAMANLKCFSDIGFCNRVCGYKEPFDYYALMKGQELIRTSKFPIQPSEGETVKQFFYSGCPYFYNEKGKARNWN